MAKSLVQEQFGATAAHYLTSLPHAKGKSLERLVELVQPKPAWRVLDVATGAGHTVYAFAPHVARVWATDITEEMLALVRGEIAKRKLANVRAVHAKAESLPFEEASFDSVVVGFGVRNVEDLEAGLKELRRVLRPGGRLGILEITKPRGPLAIFYKLWFDRIVPLLGRVLPGGAAYTYLPASVRRFPGPEELAALLGACGFEGVEFRRFAGGIVALHVGEAAS